MRKCRCEYWDMELKHNIKEYGLFHCWGVTYQELRDGVGNYTIGLVELPDGRIVESLPKDIVFMEAR